MPLPFRNQLPCHRIACVKPLCDDASGVATLAHTGASAQLEPRLFTTLEQAKRGIWQVRDGFIEMTRKQSVQSSVSLGQRSTSGQSAKYGWKMWHPSYHVQCEV